MIELFLHCPIPDALQVPAPEINFTDECHKDLLEQIHALYFKAGMLDIPVINPVGYVQQLNYYTSILPTPIYYNTEPKKLFLYKVPMDVNFFVKEQLSDDLFQEQYDMSGNLDITKPISKNWLYLQATGTYTVTNNRMVVKAKLKKIEAILYWRWWLSNWKDPGPNWTKSNGTFLSLWRTTVIQF